MVRGLVENLPMGCGSVPIWLVGWWVGSNMVGGSIG